MLGSIIAIHSKHRISHLDVETTVHLSFKIGRYSVNFYYVFTRMTSFSCTRIEKGIPPAHSEQTDNTCDSIRRLSPFENHIYWQLNVLPLKLLTICLSAELQSDINITIKLWTFCVNSSQMIWLNKPHKRDMQVHLNYYLSWILWEKLEFDRHCIQKRH